MSQAPLLYLPKGTTPSGAWEPRGAVRPQKTTPKKWLQHLEVFGRRYGTPAGAYMDDLSAQHKTIWLCWECRHKFNHKRARYFYEKNIRVRGRCDGCREYREDSHLFIHESLICDHGGKIRHEHIWTPRKGG